MPEKHLFEYAVIRVVPCIERAEFMNVGVIVFCARQKFLKTLFEVNEPRLTAFSPKIDVEEVKENLISFERICKGGKVGGTIGQEDLASRFRWLTATRSTVVQSSAVHPGLTENAQETLEKLFEKLVR